MDRETLAGKTLVRCRCARAEASGKHKLEGQAEEEGARGQGTGIVAPLPDFTSNIGPARHIPCFCFFHFLP